MKLFANQPVEEMHFLGAASVNGTLAEILTKAFGAALKAALAEIECQQQAGRTRPFESFGDLTAQGCHFRVTIECAPPKPEP